MAKASGHLKYLEIMRNATRLSMQRDGEIILSREYERTWYSILEAKAWDRYVLGREYLAAQNRRVKR